MNWWPFRKKKEIPQKYQGLEKLRNHYYKVRTLKEIYDWDQNYPLTLGGLSLIIGKIVKEIEKLKKGEAMKNWIQAVEGNLINLDHITQIRLHESEDKWYVIGDIAGKDMAYLLSPAYEIKENAIAALDAYWKMIGV